MDVSAYKMTFNIPRPIKIALEGEVFSIPKRVLGFEITIDDKTNCYLRGPRLEKLLNFVNEDDNSYERTFALMAALCQFIVSFKAGTDAWYLFSNPRAALNCVLAGGRLFEHTHYKTRHCFIEREDGYDVDFYFEPVTGKYVMDIGDMLLCEQWDKDLEESKTPTLGTFIDQLLAMPVNSFVCDLSYPTAGRKHSKRITLLLKENNFVSPVWLARRLEKEILGRVFYDVGGNRFFGTRNTQIDLANTEESLKKGGDLKLTGVDNNGVYLTAQIEEDN